MRKGYLVMLVVLVFGIFTNSLYSWVESHIEGKVKSFDNNTNLSKVIIKLYTYNKVYKTIRYIKKTESDKNGYFYFNKLRKGTYFVECSKSGYITLSPKYLFKEVNPEKYIKIFYVKEGKIKYLDIRLKKGGSLIIDIKKKTENGIQGYGHFDVGIAKYKYSKNSHSNFYIAIEEFTDSNGILRIDGLIPDNKYMVMITKDGFFPMYKDIIIKKNETLRIEHIFDFVNKTGIKVTISTPVNKNITGALYLYPQPPLLLKYGIYINIDDIASEYSFKDLKPGLYKVKAYYSVYGKKEHKDKDFFVKVVENKTSILNIEL